MNAERFELPPVTDISASIETLSPKVDHTFAQAFGKLRDAHPGWSLLSAVFDFHFEPEKSEAPFSPMFTSATKRSAIPEDLKPQELDALQANVEEVADPEYQSRIFDVLWLRQRNAQYAQRAVAAYIESAERLTNDPHWPYVRDRLERALRLAAKIDPRGAVRERALKAIEAQVNANQEDMSKRALATALIRLLVEFRAGDASQQITICEGFADEHIQANDHHRARSVLDILAKLYKATNDPNSREKALERFAATFSDEAELFEKASNYLAAHQSWSDAIAAFRNRTGLRSRLPALQERYEQAGAKAREGMATITSPGISITEHVAASRAAVKGQDWMAACYLLVGKISLIGSVQLRESAIEQARGSITSFIETTILDGAGRTVAILPSMMSTDPAQQETAIRGRMNRLADLQRKITVHAQIIPMLKQILDEHEIDAEKIAQLSRNSLLVPEDRVEPIVAGLLHGFKFDFSTALHLLVPQLENALRQHLLANGISPFDVGAQGVQKAWGLPRILNDDFMQESLGEDCIYELKSLLVDDLGQNFRHMLAHGLLSPDELEGEPAVYLWWLLLYLVVLPTPGFQAFVESRRTKSTPGQ